ncbi:hypothetical protein AB0N99_30640 [Streptomyces sp. NPDC093272]|uniref:hypothetical protein n=1 Tax=Streptomyces sp. NPDC093272 TaxID=3154981 RepID=UPI003420FC7C
MTPAEELATALTALRSQSSTAADLARLRAPITRWLDSWTGIELREDAALPEDAQHALAVARALNGSQP